MDAVVEGKLPEVDPAASEVATAGNRDASPLLQPSQPRSQTSGEYRKSARSPGSAVARRLRRLWIPLVILAVVAAGGFTVSRLHGIFGSNRSTPYSDTKIEDTKPFNPKVLRYEVFGPPGTVADISYFDGNGEPQSDDKASLPWSFEFPMTGAMGIGSIAAQGDSDSIGCRIAVDGVVKDENIVTHEVSSFTSCRLKAA